MDNLYLYACPGKCLASFLGQRQQNPKRLRPVASRSGWRPARSGTTAPANGYRHRMAALQGHIATFAVHCACNTRDRILRIPAIGSDHEPATIAHRRATPPQDQAGFTANGVSGPARGGRRKTQFRDHPVSLCSSPLTPAGGPIFLKTCTLYWGCRFAGYGNKWPSQ